MPGPLLDSVIRHALPILFKLGKGYKVGNTPIVDIDIDVTVTASLVCGGREHIEFSMQYLS